eukprot:m.476284 g.476284  ORF g.476284 m.476284 type:complete len:136 (+) comp20488_c0_seq1:211-618(+)
MSWTCARSGHKVYAADNPIQIAGKTFHPAYFTCAACNGKLILKNCTVKDGEVYHADHAPADTPNQTVDVTMESQMNVPDATMNQREFGKSDPNNEYSTDGVVVTGALNAPKVPPTVNNVNKLEVRHQGVTKFGST